VKGEERQQWLEEMAHRVPMISAGALRNFSEISDLLRGGSRLEPTSAEIERVFARGLENKAPFRRNKNSSADAVIIELYRAALRDPEHQDDTHCFVTSNHDDFSVPNGDRREPHADLAESFASPRSRYCLGVDGLHAALVDNLGSEFTDEAEEVELVHEEPRTLGEIRDAEREFFDKIWYVRKLILREKIAAGEHDPLFEAMRERVDAGMREIEERYGADNVGPWDDWEWGFINGKLSALRWVLGSEWDFLDT
jgi:PIN domain